MDVLLMIFAAIVGLLFGSFFNVVISRYPTMLYQTWQQECRDYLQMPAEKQTDQFNLLSPASRCPKCQTRIKPWHNIPILSYIFLRGKCAFCQQPISLIYPTVEFVTAVATVLVFAKFGLTPVALAAIIFTWSLIVLSFIDFKEQILPDTITLPLLWLGLILNAFQYFTTAKLAILGATTAYLMLWIIAKTFKVLRHKEGMGHGDFKLFACLCAWLGIGALLNILMIAVVTSLIIGVIFLILKKNN